MQLTFKKLQQNLDQTLPAFTRRELPIGLKTRNEWQRRGQRVRKGEKPVARLTWTAIESTESQCFQADGTETTTWESVPVVKECGLFGPEQTAPYRGSARTWAIDIFRRYFVEKSSRSHHIWWANGHWQSCHGPLGEWQMKKHLNGRERYGIRGGEYTRFLAIDLDLHNGDQAIFLEQLRVLLGEFQGKNGWHFQVANEDAGGIHLIRCFRDEVCLERLRRNFRKRLQELDKQHPELAARARAANMKTLAELEIFPDPLKGFRLPLCTGRTMLLDKPLPLVFNKRMGKDVQDVVGYVAWLGKKDKAYMPAEAILQFVQERLAVPQPKETKAKRTKMARTGEAANGMADLGPMKGQFGQKLASFWTGKNTPADSLNKGIVLLARVLPFYLEDQEEAMDLIERYIDELPDHSFSDRLCRGDRAEVSRIIRSTVRQVYNANGGQADPEASSEKLQATVDAWNKRGFNPTDKTTWHRAAVNNRQPPVNNFCWTGHDVIKLGTLQKLLNTSLDTTSDAMKYLLSLVKTHSGELAINFVKVILEGFGVNCGHNGKVNKLMALLKDWGWIYIRAYERWHERDETGEKRPGRARAYGIGEAQVEKFEQEERGSDNTTHNKNLSIASHHFTPTAPDEVIGTAKAPVETCFAQDTSLSWP